MRSNVIVGFPGETEDDVAELERFLTEAGSTRSASSATPTRTAPRPKGCPDKVDPDEVVRRVARLTALAEQLTAQRAEERIGEVVEVLIESADGEGRAAHQAPDVDGTTLVQGEVSVGDIVRAVVVHTEGVDLVADLVDVTSRPPALAESPV